MDHDSGITLSIGEVARASGLRPSALRYYEDEGLIAPVERRGGRRHYDAAVVDRLACIALCQDVGLTIAEIRELLGEDGDREQRWTELARRKLSEIDTKIDSAMRMRALLEAAMACTCRQIEGCDLLAAARHRRTSGGRADGGRKAGAGRE